MSDSAAWFIDGLLLYKEWQGLHRDNRLVYLLLRRHLERKLEVRIADAYHFNADPDPLSAGLSTARRSRSESQAVLAAETRRPLARELGWQTGRASRQRLAARPRPAKGRRCRRWSSRTGPTPP